MTTTWLNDATISPEFRTAATSGSAITLDVSICDSCRRSSFPAASRCTWCGGTGRNRATSSSGRIVAVTSVLHPTPGSELEVPYVVAMVRFEDTAIDILGRIVGTTDPSMCPAGTAVTVVADSPCADGTMHYAYNVESDQ